MTKNKLTDLNNHLFAELERLGDEDLKGEELEQELGRAKAKIKVIEKNEGPKIEYEQDGTRLYFGDDEIMINCAKYQKDWTVSIDICKDRGGNLTIGTESALRYVAQVEIPEAQYEDHEEGDEVTREKLPLDMSGVTLTLWSLE